MLVRPFFVLIQSLQRSADIGALLSFVSGSQKQNAAAVNPSEINSVAGPYVDSQLMKPVTEASLIAGVSQRQAIDPIDNTQSCARIGEVPQPSTNDVATACSYVSANFDGRIHCNL
jgi:hypothetical protein